MMPYSEFNHGHDRYALSATYDWSSRMSKSNLMQMNDEYYAETDTEDSTPSEKAYYNSNMSPTSNDSSRHSLSTSHESRESYLSLHSPAHNELKHNVQQGGQKIVTQYVPQAFKCRQLPCRTFISTGSCPYNDRCVFLHDPSIVSKPVYIKTKRKSKEDMVTDLFFWPTMSLNSVMGKTDMKNMPHIAQPFIVPAPASYMQINGNNDLAVFSMWEHFLDFCKSDSLSVVAQPRKVPPLNPYVPNNPYTGRKRLPFLVKLSENQQRSSNSMMYF